LGLTFYSRGVIGVRLGEARIAADLARGLVPDSAAHGGDRTVDRRAAADRQTSAYSRGGV